MYLENENKTDDSIEENVENKKKEGKDISEDSTLDDLLKEAVDSIENLGSAVDKSIEEETQKKKKEEKQNSVPKDEPKPAIDDLLSDLDRGVQEVNQLINSSKKALKAETLIDVTREQINAPEAKQAEEIEINAPEAKQAEEIEIDGPRNYQEAQEAEVRLQEEEKNKKPKKAKKAKQSEDPKERSGQDNKIVLPEKGAPAKTFNEFYEKRVFTELNTSQPDYAQRVKELIDENAYIRLDKKQDYISAAMYFRDEIIESDGQSLNAIAYAASKGMMITSDGRPFTYGAGSNLSGDSILTYAENKGERINVERNGKVVKERPIEYALKEGITINNAISGPMELPRYLKISQEEIRVSKLPNKKLKYNDYIADRKFERLEGLYPYQSLMKELATKCEWGFAKAFEIEKVISLLNDNVAKLEHVANLMQPNNIKMEEEKLVGKLKELQEKGGEVTQDALDKKDLVGKQLQGLLEIKSLNIEDINNRLGTARAELTKFITDNNITPPLSVLKKKEFNDNTLDYYSLNSIAKNNQKINNAKERNEIFFTARPQLQEMFASTSQALSKDFYEKAYASKNPDVGLYKGIAKNLARNFMSKFNVEEVVNQSEKGNEFILLYGTQVLKANNPEELVMGVKEELKTSQEAVKEFISSASVLEEFLDNNKKEGKVQSSQPLINAIQQNTYFKGEHIIAYAVNNKLTITDKEGKQMNVLEYVIKNNIKAERVDLIQELRDKNQLFITKFGEKGKTVLKKEEVDIDNYLVGKFSDKFQELELDKIVDRNKLSEKNKEKFDKMLTKEKRKAVSIEPLNIAENLIQEPKKDVRTVDIKEEAKKAEEPKKEEEVKKEVLTTVEVKREEVKAPEVELKSVLPAQENTPPPLPPKPQQQLVTPLEGTKIEGPSKEQQLQELQNQHTSQRKELEEIEVKQGNITKKLQEREESLGGSKKRAIGGLAIAVIATVVSVIMPIPFAIVAGVVAAVTIASTAKFVYDKYKINSLTKENIKLEEQKEELTKEHEGTGKELQVLKQESKTKEKEQEKELGVNNEKTHSFTEKETQKKASKAPYQGEVRN